MKLAAVSKPGILAVLGARKSSTIAASGERINLVGLLGGRAIILHHLGVFDISDQFLKKSPFNAELNALGP
ncbi:MAG: hypothetical protein HY847_00705 [Betaproteobacteria bacterium]|nr:hypothetical protein [Betaproteobacteria bacterium]